MYDELGWLVAFAILLHNFEEMIWLPAWAAMPKGRVLPLVPFEFRFAALVLSIFAIVLPVAINLRLYPKLCLSILVGYAVSMIVNAFLPHLALSIRTSSYMPGTATGLFLVVPTSLGFINAVLNENLMDGLTVMLWGIGVGVSILCSLPILFKIGRHIHEWLRL